MESAFPHMTISEVEKRLHQTERKFRRSCDQIVLLNEQLSASHFRYKKARKDERKSHRYPLRLRLAVIEGVRNMFYDYAYRQAAEAEQMRNWLVAHVIDDFLVEDAGLEVLWWSKITWWRAHIAGWQTYHAPNGPCQGQTFHQKEIFHKLSENQIMFWF